MSNAPASEGLRLRAPVARRRSALFLALLTALVSPSVFAQPQTGEPATFCRMLDEGVNLVSLPILPGDENLETMLSSILPSVVLVQDEEGNHFIPSQDVYDLATWSWDATYKIVMSSGAALCVQGATVVPEASPIALNEGPNWASYLQNGTVAVEEALASIESVLDRVEDAEGRVYEPGGASTLTELRAGQGYKIWTSSATPLTYPPNPESSEGDPIDVPTMNDALALTGLAPGQQITVQGYYAPGDGGGGLFEVQDNGAAPDGGTIFVPFAYRSEEKTDTWDHTTSQHVLSTLPTGQSVIYGSVTVEALHPSNGTVLFTVDGRHLHGHEYASSAEQKPYFHYGPGRFHDARFRFYAHYEQNFGGGWEGRLRATFRHSTSSLRLVRQGVGATLNVRWFGAKTYDEDPAFDNQPVIAHVMNIANARNAETPGSVTTVYLPNVNGSATTYEYFGAIEMGEGVTLRGEAGTDVVSATTTVTSPGHGLEDGTYTVNEHTSYTVSGNTITYAYRPVRVRSNATRLRVKSDEALTHIRMEKNPGDPDYITPDAKHHLATRVSVITSAPSIMAMGLQDLVLDGNWEGNHQAFTEGWATFEEKETWMRNAPGWAGFVTTNQGNKHIPLGQLVTVRNAAVLGYGSNGFLSNVNALWDGENVLLGNSVWNHTFYSANGTWQNLTFTGFAWTHCVWQRGTVNNLVFEDGGVAPDWTSRRGPDLFNIRGGDGWDEADVLGHPRFTREDGTVGEVFTRINGYFVDLRGSQIDNPFNGIGFDIQVRDGAVITDPDEGMTAFFKRNGNGPQAIYPDNLFENADLFFTSGAFRTVAASVTQSKYKGIRYAGVSSSGSTSTLNALGELSARTGGHASWDNEQFRIFEDIDLRGIVHTHVLAVDIKNSADEPVEVYVLDSKFNNASNTIIRSPGGNGYVDELENPDPSKLRVYWKDVEFRFHSQSRSNLELLFALSSFENVTETSTGRGSEDGGTYTSSSGDAGNAFVLIPTDLFWEPISEEDGAPAVTVSDDAGGIVSGFTFSDQNGQPLGSDKSGPYLRVELSRAIGASETVTFTWDAAVRPWPAGVQVPDAPTP